MNGAKWSSIARRSAGNSLPHFQFCGLEIVSAEGEDDDVRREGGQWFKLRQVPVANQSFKHPGLIQESVGADVRRLCFIGILKLSLLTSAPTLRLYLESALRARSARSARSLGIDISARGVLLVKSETGQWGRIFPTRIWGQVNTWYLPNP